METVPELLQAAARRWGARPALVSTIEVATSFEKLDYFADRFAKSLIAGGMQMGERTGIWAPNIWE